MAVEVAARRMPINGDLAVGTAAVLSALDAAGGTLPALLLLADGGFPPLLASNGSAALDPTRLIGPLIGG